LVRACLDEGAAAVVAADLRTDAVPAGCEARQCDVTSEAAFAQSARKTEARCGRVDVFCSNAGVLTPGWDVREADFAVWGCDWKIDVPAYPMAATAVLAGMIARREGYLLNTASAAGRFTDAGAARRE
jgi:NADP-dependent 3-hydroxy acid dehydrogenase YdfG